MLVCGKHASCATMRLHATASVSAQNTCQASTHLTEQPFKGFVEEGRLVGEGPLHPLGHQALAREGSSQSRQGVRGQACRAALGGQAQQVPHEQIPSDLLTL